MFRIAFMFLGLLSLVSGTGIAGTWLKRHPSKRSAEKASRIVHALFFAGLVAPSAIAFLPPGPGWLDRQLGWHSLPHKRLFKILGVILAIPGFYLLGVSNKLLRSLGHGTNAFVLTKQVVLDNVYKYTRNPMSLGTYLIWLGSGFFSGSSFITIMCLLGYIPAHLFALKYLEERELELRFGHDYLEYKDKVPFLFPRIMI